MRLFGPPTDRLEDLAVLHSRFDERAGRSGVVEGTQQAREPGSVLRVRGQGAPERPVRRSTSRVDAIHVGRQECKGGLWIVPVLGQMEHDAPDRSPGLVLRFDVGRDLLELGELGGGRHAHRFPGPR